MGVIHESHADAAITSVLDGTTRGLNKAGERLLGLSAVEVPFETGTLSGTGAVVEATTPEEGSGVVYDTAYAAHLHEHPEYNFQGGRKGKYLEDPALQNRAELGQIVAAEARRG